MPPEELQDVLHFLQALADETRLKLLGILANRECSVEELAAMLHVKAPTISHHLAKLKELNLVEMRAAGNTHFYRFNAQALHNSNKRLLTPEKIASLFDAGEADAWERKVLKDFFEGVRLKEIPASKKKRDVILKWLASQFADDTLYKESEVNEIIARHHPDTAFFRRELVGPRLNLMQRADAFYWRIPFKNLPAEPEKRSIILKALANQFEERMLYQESEVDEVITRSYPDMLFLRQELLDAGLLHREGGLYWRIL